MDRGFRIGRAVLAGAAVLLLAAAPARAIELINPFSIIKSAVEAAVAYGLAHRELEDVTQHRDR